ncbi:potassium-transporting ATPase subunit KdpA [Cytobacillus kochii]|uniref:potassium-transporting ATPase subunit KdpA n=1 Tax=Cytobacillus kochii TaxID=859143 RepID=UPI001CD6C5CC|nr:potassium-transporting ATPase subunit KdpA [Cytobacillus kochii]MCA1025873.1 potassium-transporting ATPase subunit KdpA [Cytobacillus kochii]
MSAMVIEYGLYVGILVLLAMPLGVYIGKVMNGERVFLSLVITPIERLIYRFLKVSATAQSSWKQYAKDAIALSACGFVVLFLIQISQNILPVNPENKEAVSWDLALNTAISFITNTNWQAYSGEATMSYFTQALGLTVQNFISAGMGIAVLFVIIRGLSHRKDKDQGLGNFWVDMTRIHLYILLPLSLVIACLLVSQGVVQTFQASTSGALIEPFAVDGDGEVIANGSILDDRVTVNSDVVEEATIIKEQLIPLGPAASQIAIKQLGTNGGGFFGVNSAHPFENPTSVSNFIQMLSILLIPVALVFTFGRNIRDKKQGYAIFASMFILLILFLSASAINEHLATPQLEQDGAVLTAVTLDQSGGNMEGKEARFGIVSSVVWSVFTTAASNGSVNSMLDSYTPLGGMIPMILIQLGEVIFGGVGSGLYGMIGFIIVTVFIAGLMVGRTPEYLGKKISPFEMKMAVLICLATPISILASSGFAALIPSVHYSLNNGGAHGFSEFLYAFTSAGGNNGSAFAGFSADTTFLNITLGVTMLLARYLPMIAILAIAGSMVEKKKVAVSSGTLSTSSPLFIFMVILIVILMGALSFLPALALGPIAEFLSM